MIGRKWVASAALAAGLVTAPLVASGGTRPADKILVSIDLKGPFATRSAWRFTVSQGPAMPAEDWPEVNSVGMLLPCISRDWGRHCGPDLSKTLRMGEPDGYDAAYFLEDTRIVFPQGKAGRALLLMRVSGQYGGNGDHRIGTHILAYDRAGDRFKSVFGYVTGRNQNQEVRYVDRGPLRGAVIVAEPTGDAPFGYWITVSRLTAAFTYRQVLRYRSATRYGDGNPLGVVDSDMPNIHKRLGLWRAGTPMPLPAGGCAEPRLVRMELWCS